MAFQGTNRFNKPWTPNNRTWINFVLPFNPPPSPPNTEILRGPVFTRIVRVSALVALLAQPIPNLNTTTLAGEQQPEAAPFAPVVSENPRGPRFPVELRTHITPNLRPFDPVPVGTQLFDSRITPKRGVSFDPLNLLTNTLAPAVQAQDPFSQKQWPNPAGPIRDLSVYAQQLRLPPEEEAQPEPNTEVTRAAVFSKYFPRRAQQYPFVQNLLVTTLAQAPAPKPFAQYDWPTPKTGFFFRHEIDANLVIRTDFTKPFLQNSWPLPNPKPRYREYIHGDRTNPNLFPPAEVQVATGRKEKRKWRRGST